MREAKLILFFMMGELEEVEMLRELALEWPAVVRDVSSSEYE